MHWNQMQSQTAINFVEYKHHYGIRNILRTAPMAWNMMTGMISKFHTKGQGKTRGKDYVKVSSVRSRIIFNSVLSLNSY